MADTVKVAIGNAEYTLDIPADSHVVRPHYAPTEFFTEVDRVSAIQKAIGAEVTGVWDNATNEQFSLYLRVQQATHMGIEESDGWWGKKSEAGLAGHMDPDALQALTELRESGRLAKLTYRTDVHNASWEQVETGVVERAAAPDASDAERVLGAVVAGEDPAVAAAGETPTESGIEGGGTPTDQIVTPNPLNDTSIPTEAIISGSIAGVAGTIYMMNRDSFSPQADNDNGVRHYGVDDIEIFGPEDAPNDGRVAAADGDLERPVVDVVEPRRPRGTSVTPTASSFQFDLPPHYAQYFDGSAALNIHAFLTEIIPAIRSFILGELPAAYHTALTETTQRLLPNIDKSFADAAANNNDVVVKDPAPTSERVAAPIDMAENTIYPGVNNETNIPRQTAAAIDMEEGTRYEGIDNNTGVKPAATIIDAPNNITSDAAALAAQSDAPSFITNPERAPAPESINTILNDVDADAKMAIEGEVREAPSFLDMEEGTRYEGIDNNTNVKPAATIIDAPNNTTPDAAALAAQSDVPSFISDPEPTPTPEPINTILNDVDADAKMAVEGEVREAPSFLDMEEGTRYEGIDNNTGVKPAAIVADVPNNITPDADALLPEESVVLDAVKSVAMPEPVLGTATPIAPSVIEPAVPAPVQEPIEALIPENVVVNEPELLSDAPRADTPQGDADTKPVAAGSVEVSTPDPVEYVAAEYLDIADPGRPVDAPKPVQPDFIPGLNNYTDSNTFSGTTIDLTAATDIDAEAENVVEGSATPVEEIEVAAADVAEPDTTAATVENVDSVEGAPKTSEIEVDLTNHFAASAAATVVAPAAAEVVEEVRLNIDDAPDTYRASTATDLTSYHEFTDAPHIGAGQLSIARKLGGAFIGPGDIAMATLAGGLVLAVSDYASAQRFSAEMLPFVGGGLAISEGRTAEGVMRFTEDLGGIGLTGGFAAGGTFLGGPIGSFGGAAVGMIATVEISNALRDTARGMGFDVDEGMDSRELVSFIGSLAPVYPQTFSAIPGLDTAERVSLSSASVEMALRHSKYTMEGLTSEEAYAKVGADLSAEDAAIATQQATALASVAGLESLTGGQPIEDVLADPAKFSEIYRFYRSMATSNPDDEVIVASADSLAKYNDLALERISLQYGGLMVDRMGIAEELAALDAQGPRDQTIYNRYSDVIEEYDTMSPADQEKYKWIKDAADRYERRMELNVDFTADRDAIAISSRNIARIEDDISLADKGLEPVTSQTVEAEQDALIAKMGEHFGYTADELRDDPNIIKTLEQRYIDGQGAFGWLTDLTNGTYEMNPEEVALLQQFKALEPVRQHHEFLESSPVVDITPKTDIQLEIFNRLPNEITPDMDPAVRMLAEAKLLLVTSEQDFADFKPEEAQDELDFLIRRKQYGENIAYSEDFWRDAYYNIEMRPDRFQDVLNSLGIEVTNLDTTDNVVDYRYKLPETAPAPAAM